MLACVIGALLWVRAGGLDRGGGPPAGRAVDPGPAAAAAAPSPAPPLAGAGPAPTPSLLEPYDPGTPYREPLAGVPGAIERFGGRFTIRHPAYLPADVAPFTVNWQPDRDPARRAQGLGELYTWFYSAEHGAVMVLAQGPDVGIWPLTARDGRAGRVRLADGTELIWVIGHPVSVAAAVDLEPAWSGTEITLGTPPGGDGWYLRSPLISLPELVRIAESLRSREE